MADVKITDKVPAQSIIYITLCTAGLLTLILWGIAPAYRTLDNLNNEISIMNSRIEEQKALTSLYISLKKQGEQIKSETLPLPERTKLSSDKLDTIQKALQNAAAASGLALVSAVPDLSVLNGNTQFIPVNVVCRGNTEGIKKFIIQIGALPYMDRIEKMEIQAGPEGKEFKLSIRITVG